MSKSLRNKVISVLALVACAMFAILIAINVNVAKANDAIVSTDEFAMYTTASIRGTEEGRSPGIRFVAKLGYDKFKALKGNAEGVEVVLVANKDGADDSLAVSETFYVTESTFTNDADKIIEIKYTLLFDNNWSQEKLLEAITMDLTVDAYAKVGDVKTPASITGITQNARAVASFNDVFYQDTRYAGVYYNQATIVDGVSAYVAGTDGVKINLAGATAGSDVYINTTKIKNAVIEDGVVTIAKADMTKLLTSIDANFIQVIDNDGNVIAKELTDEIPVYDKAITFSALDGDFDQAVFGGEEIMSAEVVSNDAVSSGTFAYRYHPSQTKAWVRSWRKGRFVRPQCERQR